MTFENDADTLFGMKMIERKQYLDYLKDVKGSPDIKVITGVRRSGKSELMLSFIEWLRKENSQTNIVYIDLLLKENQNLLNRDTLYDFVESSYSPESENYLFIDEVQRCDGFEETINWIYEERKFDIYITGSNAFLLSSDLATYFTGRQMEIHVFPFSFEEFSEYFSEESDIDKLFERYSSEGGLAGSYLYKNARQKNDYINSVYTTILTRDIVERYKLADIPLLYQLSEFLMGNVSELSSTNKITNKLKVEKNETNHVTVGRYIRFLCDAFLFYNVRRYDIRGKKYLETIDKYYLSDPAFRYAKLGTVNMDYGKMYENIVAIELLRRGYELYVGKLYEREIDFVAKKQNEKIYIQVSDDISSDDTFRREITPLQSIRDSYPKMLIARTKHEKYDYEGIQIIDIARWLLQH